MILTADLLSSFERGDLTTEQEREVVAELLHMASRAASQCSKAPKAEESSPELERAFDRAEGTALAARDRRDRAVSQAPALLDELSELPFPRQLAMVRNLPRFATWTFVHDLCELSRSTTGTDAKRGEELARLAVAAAEQAASQTLSPRLARDLEAEAWGQLGNALRIRFDLRGAAEALAEASRRLADGSGEPLAEARILSLRASLAADCGDFEAALALCRRAVRLQREAGARHALGRTLVQLAAFAAEAELFEEAVEAANEAAELVDVAREPRLAFALRHNRAYGLEKMGCLEEARHELIEARELAVQGGRRSDLARVRWVEGRIAAGLGESFAAEQAFREAAHAFVEIEAPFDAALVSLELSLVLLEQRRSAEVRELAVQMVPVFQSQGIEIEARAALELFQAAAMREAVERTLLVRLVAYLERARRQPHLRFDPRG